MPSFDLVLMIYQGCVMELLERGQWVVSIPLCVEGRVESRGGCGARPSARLNANARVWNRGVGTELSDAIFGLVAKTHGDGSPGSGGRSLRRGTTNSSTKLPSSRDDGSPFNCARHRACGGVFRCGKKERPLAPGCGTLDRLGHRPHQHHTRNCDRGHTQREHSSGPLK